MSLLNFGEPSPAWPYLKGLLKGLSTLSTIPGTSIGLEALAEPLIELQDDLAQDQYQERIKALLEAMHTHTAQIAQALSQTEPTRYDEPGIRTAAEDFAEWFYMVRTANKFYYADFKGIQESKFVPLPLDDIFLDLKVTAEEREGARFVKERELHDRIARADDTQRGELLAALEASDANREWKHTADQARAPGQMLREVGPAVLLGGPGSGKTTLVKRLARSCALGEIH